MAMRQIDNGNIYFWFAACSIFAMSIFFICIIACMARCDLPGSLSPISSSNLSGVICQDIPNLSFSHPHWLSWPPSAVSLDQYSSTSCCVLQWTTKETDSLNLKFGPPFNAVNSTPSMENDATMTDPFGPGPASP